MQPRPRNGSHVVRRIRNRSVQINGSCTLSQPCHHIVARIHHRTRGNGLKRPGVTQYQVIEVVFISGSDDVLPENWSSLRESMIE